MKYKLKRKQPILFALILLLVFAVTSAAFDNNGASPTAAAERRLMVIDAGHGGVDGGAVSIDGTRESDINLAIALRLEQLAAFCGVETVMTRVTDSSSLQMLSYSEHRDLANRAEIANNAGDAVLISIHQNFFSTTQPKGAQVLYSSNELSRRLAEQLQHNLVSCLDPENRRLAVPAPDRLYLTSNVNCPAILVECGFMSNFSDIEKLKDKDYQSALALVLMASYLQTRDINIA